MLRKIGRLLLGKKYLKDILYLFGNKFEVTFVLRNGYEIPLLIGFDELFPIKLPYVIINEKKIHKIQKPHILASGCICYLDKEGVVWSDDPNIALDFVFERIEKVMFENDELFEYHREFNYYFSTLNNIKSAISFYSPGIMVEEIFLRRDPINDILFFIKEESQKTLEKMHSLPKDKVLFIPLEKVYEGYVPQKDKFWSAEEIASMVINGVNNKNLNLIKRYARNTKNYYYLIEIPLLTRNKITIGLWYKKVSNYPHIVNPIIESGISSYFDISPIFIKNFDDNIFIQRGGGVLNKSKILLLGCGSVGSDILFLLARSGLKNLTIVDKDKLELENSYRHFLGFNKAITYGKKVELLKEEIEKRYPETTIETYDNDVIDLIKQNDIDFSMFDLVIIALGEPNTERYLNKMILKTETPAIFAWVEAYGIGGHALLINNSSIGCYECLYNEDLYNAASFAAKSEKPYTKNITGCSGTFTPYGGLDSMEVALITSRLALKVIENKIKGNLLYSWKGSSEELTENGYKISERYSKDKKDLMEGSVDYVNPSCKCCSGGRS